MSMTISPSTSSDTPLSLRYRRMPGRLAICRLEPDAPIPDWAVHLSSSAETFLSITRTAEELSIVCQEGALGPLPGSFIEAGWVCLQLEGPLPFTLSGILYRFIEPMAESQIPIFTISTFNTDYVLIKEEFWERTSELLQAAGHELTG